VDIKKKNGIDLKNVFVSEGWLGDVVKKPGLDLIMNLFRTQRVFAVGGFDGTWSVAKHSFLAAMLAIYWARERGWSEDKRNKLVVQLLVHDTHESVTGDILPFLKTPEVKEKLNEVQIQILTGLGIVEDESLKKDQKLLDLIAFLYEIKQAPVQILDTKKVGFRGEIIAKQIKGIIKHGETMNIPEEEIESFLRRLKLV